MSENIKNYEKVATKLYQQRKNKKKGIIISQKNILKETSPTPGVNHYSH